ncbi:DUF3347 domain-containing protein [Chitinophaga vietnamensis]|uniref:DUF3347 domain-containing protein n=1 Tax=Chitinophaga vietnamensis TaxID=2593957 RepID=UPI0011786E9D|nr:DUF3347 domain-containing protein [Chitinophaga vietnamensis]
MKKILLSATAVSVLILAACNNNAHKEAAAAPSAPVAALVDSKADAGFTTSWKAVVDQYLALKNGLAADDDVVAAKAGEAMYQALVTIKTDALAADQQKIYKDNEDDLKEHAEHIGKNAGNIGHQREHFEQMSADMLALVKAFGAGQTLYQDHCPMYNNNKGGSWLSETEAIKNPYMGSKMSDCGSVQTVFK